jgi:predicted small lipoprotein YifL
MKVPQPLSDPLRTIFAVLLACLALAGCGQKGELYIPAGDRPEQPDRG